MKSDVGAKHFHLPGIESFLVLLSHCNLLAWFMRRTENWFQIQMFDKKFLFHRLVNDRLARWETCCRMRLLDSCRMDVRTKKANKKAKFRSELMASSEDESKTKILSPLKLHHSEGLSVDDFMLKKFLKWPTSSYVQRNKMEWMHFTV